MNVLSNWNTFFKLWLYFTGLDATLFMLIANIYINGYLKYKNKKKESEGKE